MANGYSLGLLIMAQEVLKSANPQYKIEPYGFLGMLKSNTPNALKIGDVDGHKKTIKVKAKQRFTIADTTTSKSCENIARLPYIETSVSIANTRAISIYLEDEVVAQYDNYASKIVNNTGTSPLTPMLFELYDDMVVAASAIIGGVNRDLITLAAAAVGRNRRTGSNAASQINITKQTNILNLNDGPGLIKDDFQLNNFSGRPQVIGAGLFNRWANTRDVIGGTTQNGIDLVRQIAEFDVWYDNEVANQIGTDQILVYEKDSIHLVEYLEYTGFKAGPKPGASTFGTVVLPMQIGAQLVPITFDFQLRYSDCPAEYTEGGQTVVLQKGWNLILSKQFGLYTIPTTAYKSTDPLYLNRGSLRYEIVNECDTCDAGS